jgi:hypothetical protein
VGVHSIVFFHQKRTGCVWRAFRCVFRIFVCCGCRASCMRAWRWARALPPIASQVMSVAPAHTMHARNDKCMHARTRTGPQRFRRPNSDRPTHRQNRPLVCLSLCFFPIFDCPPHSPGRHPHRHPPPGRQPQAIRRRQPRSVQLTHRRSSPSCTHTASLRVDIPSVALSSIQARGRVFARRQRVQRCGTSACIALISFLATVADLSSFVCPTLSSNSDAHGISGAHSGVALACWRRCHTCVNARSQ